MTSARENFGGAVKPVGWRGFCPRVPVPDLRQRSVSATNQDQESFQERKISLSLMLIQSCLMHKSLQMGYPLA
jgi:hypothetical protein